MDTKAEVLIPCKVTSQRMVFSNMIYLSKDSAFPQNSPPWKKYIIIKGNVLCYELSSQIPTGKVGISNKLRQSLTINLIQQLYVKYYDKKQNDKPASLLSIRVGLLMPEKQKKQIDDAKLGQFMRKQYLDYYVSRNFVFTVQFGKDALVLTVDDIKGGGQNGFAFIGENTKMEFVANSETKIQLKSTKAKMKNLFSEGFTIQSLGIGGLDKELTSIFRRAFSTRRLPLSIVDKFGINHVKGILLYGPPGTGKTLIARQLAKALKAKTVQVVNGPQVFSGYVGESAENVRKLFVPAQEDMRKYGDESPLHVIIFDEIDAICGKRGTDHSGTSARDDVVNQLLTNLDGVEALNNIVVVGMTNRKDLIDPAILRPGRLQIQIQIDLPDEEGRKQIFQIHTQRLKKEGLLDKNVKLEELAFMTKNYTGAEIEAVVKNASSYAMMKGNDIMDFSKEMKLQKGLTVTSNDFRQAIEDTIPGFGIDQLNFQILNRSPLIKYGPKFQKIEMALRKTQKLALKQSSQLTSMLMYGQSGTGKTSIAANFAMNSKFTFVKIISPQKYIGVSTTGKIFSMHKTFTDAYKSKDSLIIIDNIERLIEIVKVGTTVNFNNPILQSLLVLLSKKPTNPNCKLLVIGTTSNYNLLRLFDVDKSFGLQLKIPTLDQKECASILGHDIKISDVPIKSLTEFQLSIQGTPKQLWKTKWLNFQK